MELAMDQGESNRSGVRRVDGLGWLSLQSAAKPGRTWNRNKWEMIGWDMIGYATGRDWDMGHKGKIRDRDPK